MLKLYYANISLLDDEQIFQNVFEKVNLQRREKVLRCKNTKDKKASLMAGYLLRLALEKEGLDYDLLSFSLLEKGKPIIIDVSDLCFSLSHAGKYAVCVISNHGVGVDIETKTKSLFSSEKQRQFEEVAQRIMTDAEETLLSCCENEQQRIEMFLQCWTRKESFSKADGRGLGLGLSQVETQTDSYYSEWLDEDTILSIFTEKESFSDLQKVYISEIEFL